MAQHYELNYGWSTLGPTQWTERSIVTLQADFHSYDAGDAVYAAITDWWESMDHGEDRDLFPDGEVIAYEGGCRFPTPVRVNSEHTTAWLVSTGEDAFDSIAHYANVLREVADKADADVEVTWTELPHRA